MALRPIAAERSIISRNSARCSSAERFVLDGQSRKPRSQIGVAYAARNSRGTSGGGSRGQRASRPLVLVPKTSARTRAPRFIRTSPFRGLLGFVAMLDDVARLEQNAFECVAPLRFLAQQKLEVHAKMLHLLVLRVAHDRERVFVFLDREALLVPTDRLRLLDERGDHACEGASLFGQLVRRLVILVEAHDRRCG